MEGVYVNKVRINNNNKQISFKIKSKIKKILLCINFIRATLPSQAHLKRFYDMKVRQTQKYYY